MNRDALARTPRWVWFLAIGIALACCFGLVLVVLLLRPVPAAEPGTGPEAERGYRAAEAIIAALERHHVEQGQYPTSLDGLVPVYLEELPAEVVEMTFVYTRVPPSYSLEFSYLGQGLTTCLYTPEDGWDCYRL